MDGTGDIALVKDTVYDTYCTGDDAYEWRLDRDEVVMLEPFGQAPSHPRFTIQTTWMHMM